MLTSFSIDNPPIWATLHFHKKILIPPSLIFQKSQVPINKGSGGGEGRERGGFTLYILRTKSPETILMVRWMRDIFELNKQKQTNRKQNASNREDFK